MGDNRVVDIVRQSNGAVGVLQNGTKFGDII